MAFPEPFFRWRPHPWHGLDPGPDAPEIVTAFIEISPFDFVKYEVEKRTGYLKVDRPQRGSSSPPTLYGLIPKTFCAERVAAMSPEVTDADGDPLDICVISERAIDRSEIMLYARVVGGLRMIDHGEADDKIVAVLVDDAVLGWARDISDIPNAIILDWSTTSSPTRPCRARRIRSRFRRSTGTITRLALSLQRCATTTNTTAGNADGRPGLVTIELPGKRTHVGRGE